MISKTLLTIVLGKTIIKLKLKNNKIVYVGGNTQKRKKINIYELAHKCKEWARDNDFFLRSFYDYEGAFCYISAPEWVDKINIPKTGFSSETEPEAIIEACEYILQQNKKGI